MSVLGEAHQSVLDSLDFTRSRAVDPIEVWSKEEEKKEEHRTTKNCGENENGKQQQRQRQRQQVEQGGEEEERGPSLEDIKRALRQNFRDTGVVDDVTVRTALLLYIKLLLHGGILPRGGTYLLLPTAVQYARHTQHIHHLFSRQGLLAFLGMGCRLVPAVYFARVVTCVGGFARSACVHVALAATFSLSTCQYQQYQVYNCFGKLDKTVGNVKALCIRINQITNNETCTFPVEVRTHRDF